MKQEMMRWKGHQLDHMQIICTSIQTDNHAITSSFITDFISHFNKKHETNVCPSIYTNDVTDGRIYAQGGRQPGHQNLAQIYYRFKMYQSINQPINRNEFIQRRKYDVCLESEAHCVDDYVSCSRKATQTVRFSHLFLKLLKDMITIQLPTSYSV